MRTTSLSSLLIIEAWLAAVAHAAAVIPVTPAAPRDIGLVKRRAPADCGYWTMHCAGNTNKEDPRGAYSACNNACYYIQCMEGMALKEVKGDDGKVIDGLARSDWAWHYDAPGASNRGQSGCDPGSGQKGISTICNMMPFSQQFNDVMDQKGTKANAQALNVPLTGDPNDERSCDEFPMNQMKLWNFNDKSGPGYSDSKSKIRASLRCMPHKQNQNGGTQLSNLVADKTTGQDKNAYPQPHRDMNKCPDTGGVVENDQFKMEFMEIDKDKTPYCMIPKDEAERKKICSDNNDGLQWFMTYMSGKEGSVTMPYDISKDNRYAVHTGDTNAVSSPKELQQCQVDVERDVNITPKSKKDMWVQIKVRRSAKTGGTNGYKEVGSFDQKDQCSTESNKWTINKKAGGLDKDLVVKFNTAGTKDTIDQSIDFEYGDFKWDSKTTGKSKAITNLVTGGDDYSYCYSTKSKRARTPEEVVEDPMGKVKKEAMTCFFPCYEP